MGQTHIVLLILNSIGELKSGSHQSFHIGDKGRSNNGIAVHQKTHKYYDYILHREVERKLPSHYVELYSPYKLKYNKAINLYKAFHRRRDGLSNLLESYSRNKSCFRSKTISSRECKKELLSDAGKANSIPQGVLREGAKRILSQKKNSYKAFAQNKNSLYSEDVLDKLRIKDAIRELITTPYEAQKKYMTSCIDKYTQRQLVKQIHKPNPFLRIEKELKKGSFKEMFSNYLRSNY